MDHQVVSRDEWIKARRALLAREKDFTHVRDALNAARRDLPWVKVDKNYVFDGSNGKETLADLFDGRSQLIVYHFMFGPDWEQGCPSCSFVADHIDGSTVHLAQRDVTLLAVSRATLAQIDAFKKRMGWRFKWVSSYANDFNRDYHVSFTKEELAKGKVDYNFALTAFPIDEAHGVSAFYKDENGDVFHTFLLRARLRHAGGGLQLSRHRPQGTRRGRAGLHHGMGAPPRPLRGRWAHAACEGDGAGVVLRP